MAEQKTEIKPLFQSRFWRSSLPRSWYKWSAMLLPWVFRWDTWLLREGKEPQGARLTQSFWLLQRFLLGFCLQFSPHHFLSALFRQAKEQPPPLDKVRLAIHATKSRNIHEELQNCEAYFCSQKAPWSVFRHILVSHFQSLQPQTHWPSFANVSPG